MGHFKLKSKINLNGLEQGAVLEESDFSTVTPEGNFLQFEYVSEDNKVREPYPVNPGIYSVLKTMSGFVLEPTAFVNDKILEEFVNTKEIESIVDCFFSNLHVYAEEGIEVPKRGVLLYGPAGCHAKGTKIMLSDGTFKNVEDIKVGDMLMGPDSKPREVLQLRRGRQEMVKIIPNKGESFIINKDHILHLAPSGEGSIQSNINIKFSDYLNETECFKERFKLQRTGVDFEQKNLPIDPYILGLWLGDGTSENIGLTTADEEIKNIWISFAQQNNLDYKSYKKQINSRCETIRLSSKEKTINKNLVLKTFQELELINNKHIPHIYLTSSRQQRLQLLAGLIDTDGTTGHSDLAISKGRFGTGYSYVSKSERLADNVVYLARSLGFAAYKSQHTKGCYVGKKRVFEDEYFYVSISGDLSEVPVVLNRKKCKERVMNKDVLRTGFTYELLPEDDYFGFTLNGDHLYLTSDFTVHHNSGKTTAISKAIRKYSDMPGTFVLIWHTSKYEADDIKSFIKSFGYNNVERMVLVAEDLGGMENDSVRMRSDSALLSLLDNQELTFTKPTMIIATTNYAENFAENLTNRPGRFDDKLKVGYLDSEARKALLKFFTKGNATEEQLRIIASKDCEKFLPAHIREAHIRSRLRSEPLDTVLKKIAAEIKLYDKAFDDKSRGIGI